MEIPRILFIPVASKIHFERVVKPARLARVLLETTGFKIFGPIKPITRGEDAINLMGRFDCVVLFIASGGVGKLVANLASGRELILWAYPENNSLPSALSARERLIAKGAWKGRIVYSRLEKVPPEMISDFKSVKLIKSLVGVRVGLIGDERDFEEFLEDVNLIEVLFGLKVVKIPIVNLYERWKEVPDEEARRIVRRLLKAEVVEPREEDLTKSAKLYLALRSIMQKENLDAVSFECFKFLITNGITPCVAFSFLNDEGKVAVCEGDLRALTLMLIFYHLTGEPSWVANLSQIDEESGTITLAHCTAATKLSESLHNLRIRSHFESGLGVSLEIPLKKGPVTIANLQLKPLKLVVVEGEVVDSKMSLSTLCRTQGSVKIAGNLKLLMDHTGNHQVLNYGDLGDLIEEFARKIGATIIMV